MARNKSYSSRANQGYSRPAIMGFAVLAAAVIAVVVLELTNTTHLFHTQKVPPVITVNKKAGSSTSPITSQSAPVGGSVAPTSDKTPASAGGTPSNTLQLITPYGNFVSNHKPGQDGSTLDEVSVCNSTPGASCYIKFTNGQVSTQLPVQMVGAGSSTSWSWNVGTDAHLTSGEWQVTAVASFNDQTKSTDDPIKLEVQ